MIGDRNILRPEPSAAQRALGLFGEDAEDRAAKLLGTPGMFDSWRRVQTFDVQGGQIDGVPVSNASIEVTAAPEAVDLTQDALTVALLWDDAQALEAGPKDVQAGGIVRLDVSAERGNKLEVWVSGWDSFGSARVLRRGEADERERERAAADQEAAQDRFNPSDFLKGGGAVFAVVGLVALVILLKT